MTLIRDWFEILSSSKRSLQFTPQPNTHNTITPKNEVFEFFYSDVIFLRPWPDSKIKVKNHLFFYFFGLIILRSRGNSRETRGILVERQEDRDKLASMLFHSLKFTEPKEILQLPVESRNPILDPRKVNFSIHRVSKDYWDEKIWRE